MAHLTSSVDPVCGGIETETEALSLSVAVFCGSKTGTHPGFSRSAKQLGAALAACGHVLIYGAGSGLMKDVAEGHRNAGGNIVGIVPKSLIDAEATHHTTGELVVTDTLRQRKERMFDIADGFLVLPGGIGTLDELVEIYSQAHLGFHNKPVIVFNDRGYWTPFKILLSHFAAQGFLGPHRLCGRSHDHAITFVTSIDEAMQALQMPR